MTPGPTTIRRCQNCNGLLKQRSFASGNSIGATVWTDGEFHARMLPKTTPLIACSHCRAVLWVRDLEEVDSYAPAGRYSKLFDPENKFEMEREETARKAALYDDVPFFAPPTETELFVFVRATELPAEKEQQARILAWRKGNDKRRTTLESSPLSAEETDNLERLVPLLKAPPNPASVLLAEALRELGRLEDAKALIKQSDFPTEQNDAAQFILELIDQGDSHVREILKDSDREWRLLRRLRRQQEVNASPPTFDPSGPPPFVVTSRDWWFKVVGMLCHNWALIEEKPEGDVAVYFFHDQGKTKRGVPGYSFNQLQGRAAIVDTLAFSSIRSAQHALLRNGFNRLEENPGPWDGEQPTGVFFDARATEEGIYSRGGYWIKD